MNPHDARTAALALVFVLAGCSNQTTQLAAPSAEFSRDAPGYPPIEQSSPPRIRVWTDDGWRQAQKVGAFTLAPENTFDLEIQQEQAVTLHWSAQPAGLVNGYRWSVDNPDITDETPRIGPEDVAHWSAWSRDETTATVGPFRSGLHWVYIEARTKVGFISLFPLRVQTVPAPEPVTIEAR